MQAQEEGTEVANGKHVVPPGVAVEELDGGKKKLSETCPPDLQALLTKLNAVPIYNKMVASVVDEANTRSLFGTWQDMEFNGIIDLFRDEFAEQGIQVALCKRSGKRLRWIEFIDTKVAKDYIPQYDVANTSGQIIRTCYCTLEFPYGVAVEELKQWKGRKILKNKIPIFVEKMMMEKKAIELYEQLVEECIHNGVGARLKSWNMKKLQSIMQDYSPRFEAKGIAIFLSHKLEYVSHGQNGGHTEMFRWIEFVDKKLQPNYYPQREADPDKEKCVVL